MARSSASSSPEFLEALANIREMRRILDLLPGLFHDRVQPPNVFSATRMSADLLKCAVALDGLKRIKVYLPEDFSVLIHRFRLQREMSSPLAISAVVGEISAGLLARALRFAVPGTEIDWAIVRHSIRRAAVAVYDEAVAEEAMSSMRLSALIGLDGVSRAPGRVTGASDAILIREAERVDASDPPAALASALAVVAAARLRIRRARWRIKEARRNPRSRRRKATASRVSNEAAKKS